MEIQSQRNSYMQSERTGDKSNRSIGLLEETVKQDINYAIEQEEIKLEMQVDEKKLLPQAAPLIRSPKQQRTKSSAHLGSYRAPYPTTVPLVQKPIKTPLKKVEAEDNMIRTPFKQKDENSTKTPSTVKPRKSMRINIQEFGYNKERLSQIRTSVDILTRKVQKSPLPQRPG